MFQKKILGIFLIFFIIFGVLSYINWHLICFAIKNKQPCIFWVKKIQDSSHEDVLSIIEPLLPTNPIVIEAGAYDGSDSIYMAYYWKQGKIYSFEPVPELYAKVIANTKNIQNICAYQIALSDKQGETDFFVSSDITQPDIPTGSSSLLPPTKNLDVVPNMVFKKKIRVQTMTIDQWAEKNNVNHVDFIWLDTQGSEFLILKGSPKILKTVKAILLEVEFIEAYKGQALFGDIKEWLESEGFILAGLNIRPIWYGDALFIRK